MVLGLYLKLYNTEIILVCRQASQSTLGPQNVLLGSDKAPGRAELECSQSPESQRGPFPSSLCIDPSKGDSWIHWASQSFEHSAQ